MLTLMETAALWRTIAVTALPTGWRNVFTGDDGETIYRPCPAILLQERYAQLFTYTDRDDETMLPSTKEQPFSQPRATRTVFALCEPDGTLVSVLEANNYTSTIPSTAFVS